MVYPYTAISVKRFHDIHENYGATSLFYCIVGCIVWGLGALVYIGYMLGGESQGPNKHGRYSLMSFGNIWKYESEEIRTARKWEENFGFHEAILIYTNLSRSSDISRVKNKHVTYLKKELTDKLSFLKKKGIDCTGLEISLNHLEFLDEDSS